MIEGKVEEHDGVLQHTLRSDGVLLMPRAPGAPHNTLAKTEWGHYGNAAAQTAYIVLFTCTGSKRTARKKHLRFKREVVSRLWYDRGWTMGRGEVLEWVAEDERALAAAEAV